MRNGALRRLLLTRFPSLVGSLFIGAFFAPLLPQSPAAPPLTALPCAHVEQASDVQRDDPQAPGDGHDPVEPVEETGLESAEGDPSLVASAATPAHVCFQLCAGVFLARPGAPRECECLRRLTATWTVRGPPRAASIASHHVV